MVNFKDEWDIAMALEVLNNRNVDSKLWSEAAKWIMLYGPQELREVMQQASSIATKECFPNLEPEGYTGEGDPCYDIDRVAEALGITRQEAMKKLAELEDEHGVQHLFDASETGNIH